VESDQSKYWRKPRNAQFLSWHNLKAFTGHTEEEEYFRLTEGIARRRL
jgi:hypothetical protein